MSINSDLAVYCAYVYELGMAEVFAQAQRGAEDLFQKIQMRRESPESLVKRLTGWLFNRKQEATRKAARLCAAIDQDAGSERTSRPETVLAGLLSRAQKDQPCSAAKTTRKPKTKLREKRS